MKYNGYIKKIKILSEKKSNILKKINEKQQELDNLNINNSQKEDLLQKHKLFEQEKKTELKNSKSKMDGILVSRLVTVSFPCFFIKGIFYVFIFYGFF